MRIKEKPEDFVVKERSNVKIEDRGRFLYFILKKRDYNTINAIEKIANLLHISFTRFGFAGNKDKFAITEQVVSVGGVRKENLEKVRLKDIEITVVGYGKKPISLGDLEGNEFVIAVRELTGEEVNSFENKIKKDILIPNYFGEQRFSSQNVDVGRAIIKREFEEATKLLKLDIVDNDYIGALRKLNKKVLKIYVHAYQSCIFNETVKEYLKEDIRQNEKVPIFGFGTELENYNLRLQKIINGILDKEKISIRDFILPRIPELSEYGTERWLFVEIKNLEVLEKGEDFVKIKFFLRKGSYATEAVKWLFDGS